MRALRGALAATGLLLIPAAQASEANAWERFCAQTALTTETTPAVDGAAQALVRSPLHFRELMIRGEPWFWPILQQTQQRGMPAEIALLPAIESGFQARAESHRAAAGLWQLIPSTARRFGLRVDDGLDQRLDVGHATRAALDYLEYLHGRFGNWPLALAAYNAGEGRIVRALHAVGASPGADVRREALQLPPETIRHYRRLLGMTRVVCAPEAHGVRLPTLPARSLIRLVHLDRPVDLAEIAAIGRMSRQELESINPAHAEQPSSAPHRLWIPAHQAGRLRKHLSEADGPQLVDFGAYRVRRGDTLSHIALRHGTSTSQLRSLNELPDSRIRIGMELRVPLASGDGRREL